MCVVDVYDVVDVIILINLTSVVDVGRTRHPGDRERRHVNVVIMETLSAYNYRLDSPPP